jgi:hypothetical protein
MHAPIPRASARIPPVLSSGGRSHGPVAQWSEQGTHNPLVGGSNPSRPTLRLQFCSPNLPEPRECRGGAVPVPVPSPRSHGPQCLSPAQCLFPVPPSQWAAPIDSRPEANGPGQPGVPALQGNLRSQAQKRTSRTTSPETSVSR